MAEEEGVSKELKPANIVCFNMAAPIHQFVAY